MNILQVLPAMHSGGVEKGTLEIAQSIVAAGHRSIVMSNGGRMVNELIDAGSEHIQWPIGEKSIKTLFLIRRLRSYLIKEQIDVVHARSRLPAWIVFLAWRGIRKQRRPKFITTVHGFNSVNWYSAVMTYGENVIAVSNSVRDFIEKNYPKTNMSKVKVIYRGINPDEYYLGYKPSEQWIDKWLHDFPLLKAKKIITLPGRVTRLKGHEDFIQIIEEISKQRDDIVGVIAGGYEERKKEYFNELEELVREKGLTEKIIFAGHRTDMKEVLAISDVVISLTQKPESFGRTTLEALSMGVPVVGYDHGGVGEQLKDLFEPGRVEFGRFEAVIDVINKILHEKIPVKSNNKYILQKMQSETLSLYEN